MLHVQSCFFSNWACCFLFTVLVLRLLALHDCIFCLANYTEILLRVSLLPWLNLYIYYYQEYYNETLVFSKILRPGSDAAPLMCRT